MHVSQRTAYRPRRRTYHKNITTAARCSAADHTKRRRTAQTLSFCQRLLPLLYLIPDNMSSPLTAPNFCMPLRKYIQNGRILSISQPGLERIVRIRIEHLNDLGDLCTKVLIIELMGKHSNLIFCEETDTIIDSIKHVSGMVSSVREVLPGRTYFIPQTQEKYDPLTTSEEVFHSVLPTKAAPALSGAVYNFYSTLP